MIDGLKNIEQEILYTQEEIKKLQVLTRVNNLLLSRFILQLQNIRKEFGIPKRQTLFKFEILDEDYQELISEFGSVMVDKALYRLDRLLLKNKQNCPHNIKKYLRTKLLKSSKAHQDDSKE